MDNILKQIKELGATNAAAINVCDIPFAPELIEFCNQNSCGNFGKCWVCPPLVGEIDVLIDKVKKYEKMLVFQVIYPLEDSFDFEGMMEAQKEFRILTDKVADLCKAEYPDMLMLSAGGCAICNECTAPTGEPCRFPEKARPAFHAVGIDVFKTVRRLGLPLNVLTDKEAPQNWYSAVFVE